MAEMKRCKQCGLLKEVEQFRLYTYSRSKGTPGRYRYCKQCESINAAYTRAKKQNEAYEKGDAKEHARVIEAKIEALYGTLESKGFRTPLSYTAPVDNTISAIDSIMSFYEVDAPKLPVAANNEVPDDLQRWLTMDYSEWSERGLSPEYLQETVYESLKAKYRPQIGIDREKYIPVYDDTYKDVLNKILARFDDYEDNEEDQE